MFFKLSLILYGCFIILQLKSLRMISADNDDGADDEASAKSNETDATTDATNDATTFPNVPETKAECKTFQDDINISLKNDECGDKLLQILFNGSAFASFEFIEYSNDNIVYELLNSSHELPNFTEIQKLSLKDIKFSNDNKLYIVHTYSKLKEIEISKCYLEEVRFKKSLESLESINLSDNSLTENRVIFFARLSKVTTLNLNNNYFRVLSWKTFAKLKSLEKLSLAGNQIIFISQPHGALTLPKMLNSIDLSDNFIKLIIPQLKGPNLKVNLTNNPLDCSYYTEKDNNLRNIEMDQCDLNEPKDKHRNGKAITSPEQTATSSPLKSNKNIYVPLLKKLEKLITEEHFYYSISFFTAYTIALICLSLFAFCIINKCCNCNCKSKQKVNEKKPNNVNITMNDDNKYPEEIYYSAPPEDYYECTPEPSRKDHHMELYAAVHKNKNHSEVNEIVEVKLS